MKGNCKFFEILKIPILIDIGICTSILNFKRRRDIARKHSTIRDVVFEQIVNRSVIIQLSLLKTKSINILDLEDNSPSIGKKIE